jgi:hypothetical protein
VFVNRNGLRYRCLQRHGVSRLPDVEGDKPKRQRFKRYSIGFCHIDMDKAQTAEGKPYLPVGIDRTNKIVVTRWSTRSISGQHGSFSNTC